MRFKRETWQPTIGDKYILVVTNEKAIALDRFDAKKFYKSLADNGLHIPRELRCGLLTGKPPVLTSGYLGIQTSSKYIIEQYRKSRDKQ